jgi:PRTRC genetic system ThiF family protein
MTEYTVAKTSMPSEFVVTVIGCGGTGSFVVEGLCRLPALKERKIVLIDHDIVEEHNLRRQNFFAGDVGKFKSQVLAERLSRRYSREITFSVYPYRPTMMIESDMGSGFMYSPSSGILIGCVDDSTSARKDISEYYRTGIGWWIDSGNAEHSGQVLIGNASKETLTKSAFVNNEARRLPLPTVQQPQLLQSAPKAERQMDCAEAVEVGGQSPVINQFMATLVLDYVYRLLSGTLKTMGTYINLEAGTMTAVAATPENVSRVTGIKEKELMGKGRR